MYNTIVIYYIVRFLLRTDRPPPPPPPFLFGSFARRVLLFLRYTIDTARDGLGIIGIHVIIIGIYIFFSFERGEGRIRGGVDFVAIFPNTRLPEARCKTHGHVRLYYYFIVLGVIYYIV